MPVMAIVHNLSSPVCCGDYRASMLMCMHGPGQMRGAGSALYRQSPNDSKDARSSYTYKLWVSTSLHLEYLSPRSSPINIYLYNEM